MPNKPKVIIFASGTQTSGGSGFRTLVENARVGNLKAKIAAVVSNHKDGGVRKQAADLGVPFIHFTGNTAEAYQGILKMTGAQWVILSGWLKIVTGLNPRQTINIHPGKLPLTKGLWGIKVHERTLAAYRAGEIEHAVLTMHFVTEEVDDGPIFFEHRVFIRPDDTAESLQERVKNIEHGWQWYITNLVIRNAIWWNGQNSESLVVPRGFEYRFLEKDHPLRQPKEWPTLEPRTRHPGSS